MIEHWTCPYCNRDTTIRSADYRVSCANQTIPSSSGHLGLKSVFVVCPNKDCRKTTLKVVLCRIVTKNEGYSWDEGQTVKIWNLLPPSKAKTFPSYVPDPIISDYNEACLIANDSPKASATLARRCLQGIIRDFWKVKPGRLINEIKQIEDKVDPDTWGAIDSVRKVGNIGAHMEKDIDLIVDVEPKEAELLIGLIETLITDWYISREGRRKRLGEIKNISERNDNNKNGS